MTTIQIINDANESFNYVYCKDKLEVGDVAIQLETNEIFEIAIVLEPDHLYVGKNGKTYWDNFDPWSCRKLVSTTNPQHQNTIDNNKKML